jgi:hypothetical protein
MFMFIAYAIDSRYPLTGWSIPGKLNEDYVQVNVVPANSIKGIAKGIVSALQNAHRSYHSVDLVILAAHGNTGYLQIGEGLTSGNADNFEDLARWMRIDLFGDGMRLHGCGVASSTDILGPKSTITNPQCIAGTTSPGFNGKGYVMLHGLAKAINRNVTAGVNCQYTDAGWKFEGPTVTVNPNGSWGLTTTT